MVMAYAAIGLSGQMAAKDGGWTRTSESDALAFGAVDDLILADTPTKLRTFTAQWFPLLQYGLPTDGSGFEETVKLAREYGGYVNYGYMDAGTPTTSDPLALGYLSFWSLSNYKSALDDAKDESDDAREEWDELEKSIVASIAKDVVVGVKKNTVEMRITI